MGLRTPPARLGSVASFAAAVGLLCASTSCRSNVGPTPVENDETFTGILQPGGAAFHTFTVAYSASFSDLGVILNSLTPLPTITVGLGFGVPTTTTTGTACPVQIGGTAVVGQELDFTNAAQPGTFCVQIVDVNKVVTEPVTYSILVRHF